jgi:hypothetical protein
LRKRVFKEAPSMLLVTNDSPPHNDITVGQTVLPRDPHVPFHDTSDPVAYAVGFASRLSDQERQERLREARARQRS